MRKIFLIILLFGVLLAAIRKSEASNFKEIFEGLHLFKEETFEHDLNEKYEEDFNSKGSGTFESGGWSQVVLDNEAPPFKAATLGNSNIIGKYMQTIKDRTIYAYQGFRYAETFQSGLRFKPPNPVDVFWTGDTFYANHIGFKCPQSAMVGSGPSGDEDCLYLNIYTPYFPGNTTELLPVMFFIHGGGFIMGDSSMYLPTKLLDHDVILVAIHYRLGALGFCTLNNAEFPGNAGLYDMIEALKWTQKHIEDFGGDKDKVTIFGESAGSVSVNYMMLLPAAKGLFRGVIAESGSALDHWAVDEEPTIAINYIANYLNCPIGDDDVLFECLNAADPYDIVTAQSHLEHDDMLSGGMGFRGAAPTLQDPAVINTTGYNYELIFTKRPREYFKDGEFNDVPFMTGANKQEGSFVLGTMYWGFYIPHNLENNATYMREEMVNDILNAIGVVDDTQSLATSLTLEYCAGFDLGNFTEAAPCLIDMVGVLFLKAGSWEMVDIHSYYSTTKTYYYSFEFESDDTMYIWLLGAPVFDPGVTHSDELMYIFSMPAVMEGQQITTMDRMTTLWTNFAIYGEPTPASNSNWKDLGIPEWTPYEFEDHHFLLMSDEFTVEQEFTDRWTVTVDELSGNNDTSSTSATTTEKTTKTTTTKTTTTTTIPPTDPPICYSQAEYDSVTSKRDAYETAMIVFIVAFVLSCGLAIYFFFKGRN